MLQPPSRTVLPGQEQKKGELGKEILRMKRICFVGAIEASGEFEHTEKNTPWARRRGGKKAHCLNSKCTGVSIMNMLI